MQTNYFQEREKGIMFLYLEFDPHEKPAVPGNTFTKTESG